MPDPGNSNVGVLSLFLVTFEAVVGSSEAAALDPAKFKPEVRSSSEGKLSNVVAEEAVSITPRLDSVNASESSPTRTLPPTQPAPKQRSAAKLTRSARACDTAKPIITVAITIVNEVLMTLFIGFSTPWIY